MASSDSKVTVEQREEFLRARGWSQDLPTEEREQLESQWSDEDIEMALALGYA